MQPIPRSYHHRHLDFSFAPATCASDATATGTRRLTVHSAEILRGVLGGDLTATGYKTVGVADLPEPVAQALELALRDLRTDLSDETDPPTPTDRKQRRKLVAERLEAFCKRNLGNPLVANGVVIDPKSEQGKRLVAQISAGQAEPRLLAEWVRLRIEWRQIVDA